MTNFEKIMREMTPKMLADGIDCPPNTESKDCENESCYICMLEWLKSEVEQT